MNLSWECFLNYSFRCQYIFSLFWSNLSFSWWKEEKKNKERKKNIYKKSPKKNPCHSYFPVGIICGPHRGSFAVRDHLRFNLGIISGLGIICGRGSFAALYRAVNDHNRRKTISLSFLVPQRRILSDVRIGVIATLVFPVISEHQQSFRVGNLLLDGVFRYGWHRFIQSRVGRVVFASNYSSCLLVTMARSKCSINLYNTNHDLIFS